MPDTINIEEEITCTCCGYTFPADEMWDDDTCKDCAEEGGEPGDVCDLHDTAIPQPIF